MTDLTRYPIGNDSAGRITLWCNDCPTPTPRIELLPIWNQDDAAEQVTELCLANLVAIAEEHERQHHPYDPYEGLTIADVDPDALADGEEADRWADAEHDAQAEHEDAALEAHYEALGEDPDEYLNDDEDYEP